MAKGEKRPGLPKKQKVESGPSLFDYLNDIMWDKKNILTPVNSKKYSKFMIARFLATREEYLPIAQVLNQYQDVWSNELFHEFCIEAIPRKKVFLDYKAVNAKAPRKQVEGKVKIIAKYFEISDREAYEWFTRCGVELVENIEYIYGL
jgi:hypothetical protein